MRAVSSNSCASRRSPRGIVSVPSASTRLSLATVSSARSSIPHDSRARRRSAGGSAGCTAWRFAACRSVRMYLIRSLAARPSRTNSGSSSPESPVVAMMRSVLVSGVQCCNPGTAAVGGFPATRAAHALRTIERWIAMLPLWRRTRAAREPDGDVNFDVLGDRDIDAAPVRDAVQTKLGPIDLECRFEAVVPDGDRHVDAPRHVADRQIAGHGDRAVRAHDRRGADESHRRILIDVEELAGLEQLNVIGILHVDAAREDRELDMRVRRPVGSYEISPVKSLNCPSFFTVKSIFAKIVKSTRPDCGATSTSSAPAARAVDGVSVASARAATGSHTAFISTSPT